MMSSGRTIIALATTAAALLIAAPLAAQQAPRPAREPFTAERFAALQSQGALVLVEVYADWCPTCAMQQRVLTTFRAEHPDVPLYTLTVDFDTQKQWVQHFGAPRQSTLILYKGQERRWFSVAETRAAVISAQLSAAATR